LAFAKSAEFLIAGVGQVKFTLLVNIWLAYLYQWISSYYLD